MEACNISCKVSGYGMGTSARLSPERRALANLECNAPTGGVRPDIGKGVQLLGKSTGSYGE